jgi:hypothetical protein
MLGDPVKTVKVSVSMELEFSVGGDSDEDRIDSVKMLMDDHYDDMVNSFYFSKAVKSMTAEVVSIEKESDEKEGT